VNVPENNDRPIIVKTFKEFVDQTDNLVKESHQHLLPREGEFPYVPPKSCHQDAHRVKGAGKEVYADDSGRHWSFDMLHKNHWDVSNPNGKAKGAYVRVDTAGTMREVHARSKAAGQQLLLECGITASGRLQIILE
jgi:hypothetical protein